MAVQTIVQFPKVILRRPVRGLSTGALAALDRDFTIDHAVKALVDTMRAHDECAALAAPQIGLDLPLFVVRGQVSSQHDPDFVGDRTAPLVFLRPRAVAPLAYGVDEDVPVEEDHESCMSFAGKGSVRVRRAVAFAVTALDAAGTVRTVRATGFYARILQHELDHLRGRTIYDHASFSLKQKLTKPNYSPPVHRR